MFVVSPVEEKDGVRVELVGRSAAGHTLAKKTTRQPCDAVCLGFVGRKFLSFTNCV